jgi:hypothetical protein
MRSVHVVTSCAAIMAVALLLQAVVHGVAQRSESQAARPVSDLTIADLTLIAAGTEDLVGRPVYLRNVRVLRLADTHGFYLDAQTGAVFVLPERFAPPIVAAGDVVTIQGVIADTPRPIADDINPPAGWNERIYVMATKTTK